MQSTAMLELKNAVFGEQCVAFLGAGVSIPPSRTWGGLVADVAQECGVTTGAADDYGDIIDLCIGKDAVRCTNALRKAFPRHHVATRMAATYIHRLPFQSILTTNFDPYLHMHARMENHTRVHKYPDLPLHVGLAKGIYYLHGYFDAADSSASVNDLVLGSKSFEDAYANSLLPGFILNVVTYQSLLFIGFNPTEHHFADIVRRSLEVRKKITGAGNTVVWPKHYALWPEPKPGDAGADALISSMVDLGITPVLYDPLDDARTGLEVVLSQWVDEGDLRNRRPPFVGGWTLSDPLAGGAPR